MANAFEGRAQTWDAPAGGGFAITPHDDNLLGAVTRALYVGGGGTLSVEMASGEAVSFSGVAGGFVLPVRVRKVKASGTSATGIVGLV